MWHELITWLARRLRAENHALVNSLLGTPGFPPVALDQDATRSPVALPPVRRRTWTQIARERELAAGRKRRKARTEVCATTKS